MGMFRARVTNHGKTKARQRRLWKMACACTHRQGVYVFHVAYVSPIWSIYLQLPGRAWVRKMAWKYRGHRHQMPAHNCKVLILSRILHW